MPFDSLFRDPDMGGTEMLIRRQAWSRNQGEPLPVDCEEISAWGTIHPAGPDQLRLFPEEYRHEPLFLIHCNEPLSLGEENGSRWVGPDEIRIRDRTYRVIQIREWPAYGFWKAWAIRLQDP